MYSIKQILSAIALLLAVLGMIWPSQPLLGVAVVLLATANFVP